MKKLLITAFTLLNLAASGQTINLKWKIDKNEQLNYLTVMSDIDTSKFEVNFGSFFKSFSDSTRKGLSEAQSVLKKLNQSLKNIDLVSTLTNHGDDIVDIVMTTRPKEDIQDESNDTTQSKADAIIKMMGKMNKGVMLRGSVYATGGIHSFWVKSNQKNLIAIFFELPDKPVKVGDTWKLDIDLIANDQNFSCDSSYKKNEVTLYDIKKVKGETIAVLKYNIVEYVNGVFMMPSVTGEGEGVKTMMKFTHQAIAEFSVDKGRWISYEGIMNLDASGVLTAKRTTKFTLISE